MLLRMSAAFAAGGWADVEELPGVGPYARDAHAIFCLGRWRHGQTEPADKDLRRYVDWLRSTGGLGSGFAREVPPE